LFAIVDIETCGGRFIHPNSRIIDICILVHDGLSVVDKFSTLINPQCWIAPMYTQISGISNAMVAHAPTFAEVAGQILKYTDGHIFVAHNVSFDYNFIQGEFDNIGYNWEQEKFCTVRMARKYIPGHKSYSLGKICADLGIEIYDRHRAEGDAVATAQLFDMIMRKRNK
jgi:DNA polymerase III subunit epsilon